MSHYRDNHYMPRNFARIHNLLLPPRPCNFFVVNAIVRMAVYYIAIGRGVKKGPYHGIRTKPQK